MELGFWAWHMEFWLGMKDMDLVVNRGPAGKVCGFGGLDLTCLILVYNLFCSACYFYSNWPFF